MSEDRHGIRGLTESDTGKGAAYVDDHTSPLGAERSTPASLDVSDANAEEAYWRQHFLTRPYVDEGTSFIEYRPAYHLGADAQRRYPGKSFEEAEPDLVNDWERIKGTSSLTWDKAKHAARDAWHRVSDALERAVPGDSDNDGR